MSDQAPSATSEPSASKMLPLIPALSSARAPSGKSNFTKFSIRNMRCPADLKEKLFWDFSLRGFGIRALKSGRRSWIYQYRDAHGRTRRMALGDVSSVNLDVARDEARRRAAAVAQGTNPSVERKKKRAAGTLIEVIEKYLAHARDTQRPRSLVETERHLRVHASPLHHDRVEALKRSDIASILLKIADKSGPVAANRLRAALSAMWTWGLRSGLIEMDQNPVTFTIRQAERSRDRILSGPELKSIWDATTGSNDYSRIVRLCMLTGCRREEIGGLRWSEVGEEWIVLSSDRMKGKLAHEVPLLPIITETLPARTESSEGSVFGRKGSGFAGWSKSKAALDARIARSGRPLAHWSLHDLRRTFSTRLHDAGVVPLVVEALLAHKQQGAAAVYNRASFRNAKLSALQSWHDMLAKEVLSNES